MTPYCKVLPCIVLMILSISSGHNFHIWLDSVSCGLADFIIDFRKCIFTVELLSEFMIQCAVEHFPEFLSFHVHISIQHLESRNGWKDLCYTVLLVFLLPFYQTMERWKVITDPWTSLTNFSSCRVEELASKCLTLGSPYAPISTYSSSSSPLGCTIPGWLGSTKGQSHRGYTYNTHITINKSMH